MADVFEDNVSGIPVVLPTDIFLGTMTSLGSTNLGTVSGVSIDYDQKGRFLFASGAFVLGTTVNVAATLTLPFGQVSAYPNARMIGSWTKSSNSASTRKRGTLWVSAGGVVQFGNDDYTTAAFPDSGLPGTVIGSSGDVIYIEYRIPTVGYTATQYTAYGAGLATRDKGGLLINAIPPTGIASTDLTSLVSLTVDAGDMSAGNNFYSMENNEVSLSLMMGPVSVTGTPANVQFTLPASIPRPLADVVVPATVSDNGVQAAAYMQVTSTGVVYFSKLSGSFSASTNNTYLRSQASWRVS